MAPSWTTRAKCTFWCSRWRARCSGVSEPSRADELLAQALKQAGIDAVVTRGVNEDELGDLIEDRWVGSPVDAVIGNVPFANVHLDFHGQKLSLHDFCIAKGATLRRHTADLVSNTISNHQQTITRLQAQRLLSRRCLRWSPVTQADTGASQLHTRLTGARVKQIDLGASK